MGQHKSSHQERIKMVQAKLDGMSLKEIAKDYNYHQDTVRYWWRQYRDGGWQALCPRPHHRPERGTLSTFDPKIRFVVLRLKCEHPKWGADLILHKLRQGSSLKGLSLPSRSSIAAYLKPYLERIQGKRRSVLKRPVQRKPHISQVHECWQMDFKGNERLGICGEFAPFKVVDVLSSAPLETRLFPASLKGVSWRDVQATLRPVFALWGLPDFLRMDRGSIFIGGSHLEWPSFLLLWLVGLGVIPLINDPGRPTQNAQVERHNLTWQNHVAIGAAYATQALAQHACDTARYERLGWLPSRNSVCQGQAPLLAQAALSQPRRVFRPQAEAQIFDMERVELFLSDWSWLRVVDKVGAISLGNRNLYVSRQHIKQTVRVDYDLDLHAFVAYEPHDLDKPINIFSHPFVTPQYIMGYDDTDEG